MMRLPWTQLKGIAVDKVAGVCGGDTPLSSPLPGTIPRQTHGSSCPQCMCVVEGWGCQYWEGTCLPWEDMMGRCTSILPKSTAPTPIPGLLLHPWQPVELVQGSLPSLSSLGMAAVAPPTPRLPSHWSHCNCYLMSCFGTSLFSQLIISLPLSLPPRIVVNVVSVCVSFKTLCRSLLILLILYFFHFVLFTHSLCIVYLYMVT